MPELPEVETFAADLRPLVVGRTVTAVDVRFPKMVRHPEPEAFARDLPGRRIEGLQRRGKYLVFILGDPLGASGATPPPRGGETWTSGGEILVVHLGMTGQLLHKLPEDPERPHTHVVLSLDNGTQLRYSDPRQFGRLLLGSEADLVAHRALPKLGPEPLDPDFKPAELHRRLHGRRAPLKVLLLDQSVIAGVGNIYADEACFLAAIRPDKPAGRLSRERVKRLHAAIQQVLVAGITNRGSSVDDYVDVYGAKGRQQEELQVYGRGGQPCFKCGRPLTLIRLGGRATVFCRRDQR